MLMAPAECPGLSVSSALSAKISCAEGMRSRSRKVRAQQGGDTHQQLNLRVSQFCVSFKSGLAASWSVDASARSFRELASSNVAVRS